MRIVLLLLLVAVIPCAVAQEERDALPPNGYAPDFAEPPVWIMQSPNWDPPEHVDCGFSEGDLVGIAETVQSIRWCLQYRARQTQDRIVQLTQDVYNSLFGFEIGFRSDLEISHGEARVEAFIEAHRAWLNYVGYTCFYERHISLGTGAIDATAACIDRMYNARAAELQEAVDRIVPIND